MSKAFAALAVLFGLAGFGLFSVGPKDHAHTITLKGPASSLDASKPGTFEVDFGFKTTFTVKNEAAVDLDFVLDAGTSGKCRIVLDPQEPGKCETPRLPVAKGQTITFTATGADLPKNCSVGCVFAGNCNYSCAPAVFAALPRFKSDVLIGEVGRPLHKVDPDLEVERDPNSLSTLLAALLSILSALAAWLTRRRT